VVVDHVETFAAAEAFERPYDARVAQPGCDCPYVNNRSGM
jgi:hypothetical protein